MTACKGYQKAFFDLVAGDLDGRGRRRLEEHCASCRSCREEMLRTGRVLEGAEPVRREMAEAAATVDWDRLAARITERAYREQAERETSRAGLFGWLRLRFRPVYRPVLGTVAGVAAGLLVGAVGMWLVLHPPFRAASPAKAGFHAPADFLARAELEMARRGTVDFLEKSRWLLTDFVGEGGGGSPEPARAERIQEVLSMKKYIDPHLDDARMAKAKALCDQIELLVTELARVRDAMTPAERTTLRDLIRDRGVLFKIGLVETELRQSEL